jgi:hypothetical protein
MSSVCYSNSWNSWFSRDVIAAMLVSHEQLASIVRDTNMAAMSLSFYSLRNEWKPRIGRLHDGVLYFMTITTRMLCEFSFLFRFVFPSENNKTIGTNYLTKESRQSILVEVVKWRHHANVLLSNIQPISKLWNGNLKLKSKRRGTCFSIDYSPGFYVVWFLLFASLATHWLAITLSTRFENF